MERVTWTRRYGFRSVHRLLEKPYPERLHGHHFYVEMTFATRPTVEFDRSLVTFFNETLDGHELSKVLGLSPTGENLVDWIHEKWPQALGVALQETPKNRFVSRKTLQGLV